MRILITGARGLVGRELTESLRVTDEVIPLAHHELDIADAAAVRRMAGKLRPDLIINCAVVGVDLCEERPDLARMINVDGPAALADAAQSVGSSLLHFSSNYVFDGRRTDRSFYTIEDVADPINEYGRTKLAGENEVLRRCERSWIVRTSWVFGRGKDSFLATAHRRLQSGEPVQAISDTFASTTWVRDLVTRVGEIVRQAQCGTFHIVNSGVCSYQSFAVEAARILEIPSARAHHLIESVTEAEMKRAAPRPRWTPMTCLLSERSGLTPLRDWREALEEYISERDEPAAAQ